MVDDTVVDPQLPPTLPEIIDNANSLALAPTEQANNQLAEALLFENQQNELLFSTSNEEKSRASNDDVVNSALDDLALHIGEDETIKTIYVNGDGNLIIRVKNNRDETFEFKYTFGTTAEGEAKVTITGELVESEFQSTEDIFPPIEIIGDENIQDLVFDTNNIFDAASVSNQTHYEKYHIEANVGGGFFKRLLTGDTHTDSILSEIGAVAVELPAGFTREYDEDGNFTLTAGHADGSRSVFTFEFSEDKNGKAELNVGGSRIDVDGAVVDDFGVSTINGQEEILYATDHINDRLERHGFNSGVEGEGFSISPDFDNGGFHNLASVGSFSETRVTVNEGNVPQDAQIGDVVAETEVFVDNTWVPVSELPPSQRDRVVVSVAPAGVESNGTAYGVNESGQVIITDPSQTEAFDSVLVDISIDGTPSTAAPVKYTFVVVDADTTFIPVRSDEGVFRTGNVTYGIPEDTEILSQSHFDGEDALAFGTSSVDVITYEDSRSGDTLSVVIDSDTESETYGFVLTTVAYNDVENGGLYFYDAEGDLNEVYDPETLDSAISWGDTDKTNGNGRRLSDEVSGDDKLIELRENVPGGHVYNGYAENNQTLAYVEYLDPDSGVRKVQYAYVDVNTGEWETKTADYDSDEANFFFDSYNAYNRAESNGGLIAFQNFTQTVGIGLLGLTAGSGAGIAKRAAGKGAAVIVGGEAAVHAQQSSFFGQQLYNAQAGISNYGQDTAVGEFPWETTPDITNSYSYSDGDPIPTNGVVDEPEKAAVKVEINEAEQANQQAETAFFAADDAERAADAAENKADAAERLAGSDPTDANKKAAVTARSEAKSLRSEADEAHLAAGEAGSHAAIETDEALLAASKLDDPELLVLAGTQSKTSLSLFALFGELANQNDAQEFATSLRNEAAEIYPGGNIPAEFQDEINAAEADELDAIQRVGVARLNYFDRRSDFTTSYAEYTQNEADNLDAVANYDAYEAETARLEYQDVVADGGEGEAELADWGEKSDKAYLSGLAAAAGKGLAEEAKATETEASNQLADFLSTADPELVEVWEFDPQEAIGGPSPIPAHVDILDQQYFSGTDTEDFFGSTLVQGSTYIDADDPSKTITKYVDVDYESATYGQTVVTAEATTDNNIVFFDVHGVEIGTLSEVPGEQPAGTQEIDGRRLADGPSREELIDQAEFAEAIPAGARTQRHQYTRQFAYQQYTTIDNNAVRTSWIRIRFLNANGETQVRTINTTDNPDVAPAAIAYLEELRTFNLGETYFGALATASFSVPTLIGTGVAWGAHILTTDRFETTLERDLNIIGGSLAFLGSSAILAGLRQAVFRQRATRSRLRNDFLHVFDQVPPPVFVPATTNAAGNAVPAGIDLDGDGTPEVPLTTNNLRYNADGELVIQYEDQAIPLPTLEGGGDGRIIVDDNGNVGIDFAIPNRFGNTAGDGVIDLTLRTETNLVVQQVDGVDRLGLHIPGRAGTDTADGRFIPLAEDTIRQGHLRFATTPATTAAGEINTPRLQIGDTILPIPTEAETDIPVLTVTDRGVEATIGGVRIPVQVTPDLITAVRVVDPSGTHARFGVEVDGIVLDLPPEVEVQLTDEGQWVLADPTEGVITNWPLNFETAFRIQGNQFGVQIDGIFVPTRNGRIVHQADATGPLSATWGLDFNNDGVFDIPFPTEIYNTDGTIQAPVTLPPTAVFEIAADGTETVGIDLTGDGVINYPAVGEDGLFIDANGTAGFVTAGAPTDENNNALVDIPLPTRAGTAPRLGENGRVEVQNTAGTWVPITNFPTDANFILFPSGQVRIDLGNVAITGRPSDTAHIDVNNPSQLILAEGGNIAVRLPDDAQLVIEPVRNDDDGGVERPVLHFDTDLDGIGDIAIAIPSTGRVVVQDGTELWLDVNNDGVGNYQIVEAEGTNQTGVTIGEPHRTTGVQTLTLNLNGLDFQTDLTAADNLIPVYGDETGTRYTLVPGGPEVTLPVADRPDEWQWQAETADTAAGWAWAPAITGAVTVLIEFARGVIRQDDGLINYDNASPTGGGAG